MTQHEINQRNVAALCRSHTNYVDGHLREVGGVTLDIGAFEGGYIEHWLGCGAAKVVAFEPVPWNFDVLQKRFKGDKRVLPVQIGISDKPGRIEGAMVYGAHTLLKAGGNSTMTEASENRGRKFDFDLTTIDSFVIKSGLKNISFIKLDVDGYEFHALRGMGSTLDVFRPVLMLELSGLPEKLGENSAAMVDWIYAHGYKVCTMDGEVCDSPHNVMPYYPYHSSFDVAVVPAEKIAPNSPKAPQP